MVRFGRGLYVVIVSIIGATCLAQAPITSGLVARWTGDGNAKDSAGHFDGQVSGALRYVPGPAAAQAFQFGGGAQADFGKDIGNFGTRDFSVAFWIKTDSKYFYEAFLAKRATCDAMSTHWNILIAYQPGTQAPGYVHCGHGVGGVQPHENALIATRPINDGQWHHVAWVRESTSSGGSMGLLYLDGALDISKSYKDTIDLVNQTPLVLGQNVCQCCDGCHAYSGAAAEVQIFSHALSAEDVLTLYKEGKPDK
jgi:hypothetical protein